MSLGDITHAEVAGTLLTSSLATLYTVPASRVALAVEMHVVNIDTATIYYPEVQIIPTGQSAASQYKVLVGSSVGGTGLRPGEFQTLSLNPMMAAGAFIQARELTTSNKLSFRLGVTLKEV